jgi:hypothetical protein
MRCLALLSFLLPVVLYAQCDTMFIEHFDSADAWTQTGSGNVTIAGGVAQWDHEQNGFYDFWNADLGDTLNDACFRAEFVFTVGDNPAGQGSGARPFALCAGFQDFRNYDGSGSYAYTPQDGLGLLITSVSTSDNDRDNWYLQVEEKDGSDIHVTQDLFLSSEVDTYYVVFERQSSTLLVVDVYLDAAHTALYGSVTHPVHATVQDLHVVQFGNHTAGNFSRHHSGTLDDIFICSPKDACTDISVAEHSARQPSLQAAMGGGQVLITMTGAPRGTLELFDGTGRMLGSTLLQEGRAQSFLLSGGAYVARFTGPQGAAVLKFVQP